MHWQALQGRQEDLEKDITNDSDQDGRPNVGPKQPRSPARRRASNGKLRQENGNGKDNKYPHDDFFENDPLRELAKAKGKDRASKGTPEESLQRGEKDHDTTAVVQEVRAQVRRQSEVLRREM